MFMLLFVPGAPGNQADKPAVADMRSPRASGARRLSRGWRLEDRLDRQAEHFGDAEGKGEGRIIFAGLDGIDALARHAEPLGQVGLAPLAGCAQRLEAILHQQPPSTLPAVIRL
jgi:hypothetical protein